MFKVYLAGFISGKKIAECMGWRERIAVHYMKKAWDIIWLDPINGKAIATITPDGLKSNMPAKALVARDITSVQETDLLIANLHTFGELRAPTGTICEIAIAGYLRKPMIIITDDINYTEHPFIRDFASIIVPTVDELLEKKYIDYFYKGKVSARYE